MSFPKPVRVAHCEQVQGEPYLEARRKLATQRDQIDGEHGEQTTRQSLSAALGRNCKSTTDAQTSLVLRLAAWIPGDRPLQ